EKIIESLREELDKFLAETPLSDDITLLVTDFSRLAIPRTLSEEQFTKEIQLPFIHKFDYSLKLYVDNSRNDDFAMTQLQLFYSAQYNKLLIIQGINGESYKGYIIGKEQVIPFENQTITGSQSTMDSLFGLMLYPYQILMDWVHQQTPLSEDSENKASMKRIKYKTKGALDSVELLVKQSHGLPIKIIWQGEKIKTQLETKKWVRFNNEYFPKEFTLIHSTEQEESIKVYLNNLKNEDFQDSLFSEKFIKENNLMELLGISGQPS
ncbi:MAG: hypothetical protein PF447_08490, partial [Spirochaetaceae bacterium]|nr:hypothetical protein [Spirochaetaceae bacterium]